MSEKIVDSIETVKMHIDKIRYIIDHHGQIILIKRKTSEKNRPNLYTNLETLNDLYPDDNIIDKIKSELKSLHVSDYLYTTIDIQKPNLSPLLVFAKNIQTKDVYIKIRIGVVENKIKVLSFHYAMYPINNTAYPYLE